MFINDSQDMLDIVSRLLHEYPFEITSVTTADKALSFFRKKKFDLLVTDFNLPHKSGIEIALECKNIDPNIEVIIFTGDEKAKLLLKKEVKNLSGVHLIGNKNIHLLLMTMINILDSFKERS